MIMKNKLPQNSDNHNEVNQVEDELTNNRREKSLVWVLTFYLNLSDHIVSLDQVTLAIAILIV